MRIFSELPQFSQTINWKNFLISLETNLKFTMAKILLSKKCVLHLFIKVFLTKLWALVCFSHFSRNTTTREWEKNKYFSQIGSDHRLCWLSPDTANFYSRIGTENYGSIQVLKFFRNSKTSTKNQFREETKWIQESENDWSYFFLAYLRIFIWNVRK